jgi:hypothetical protein
MGSLAPSAIYSVARAKKKLAHHRQAGTPVPLIQTPIHPAFSSVRGARSAARALGPFENGGISIAKTETQTASTAEPRAA